MQLNLILRGQNQFSVCVCVILHSCSPKGHRSGGLLHSLILPQIETIGPSRAPLSLCPIDRPKAKGKEKINKGNNKGEGTATPWQRRYSYGTLLALTAARPPPFPLLLLWGLPPGADAPHPGVKIFSTASVAFSLQSHLTEEALGSFHPSTRTPSLYLFTTS